MVRIGVVGLGRLGSAHAAVLAAHPDVAEVVVTTRDVRRAARVAAEIGAVVARSQDELFACALDGLVIATASASHPELVERATTAGVTTFCEKPVALDAAQTAQVLRHVTATGVPVQVGFQRRFDPGYVAARHALRNGDLGGLRRVHLVSGDAVPVPAAFVPTSGGIFRDLSIHDIDVLRWVTGREVAQVYALGVNRGAAYFGAAGDVDECAALLTLDDGTLATVQASRYNGAGYDVRMELAGTGRHLCRGSVRPFALPVGGVGCELSAGSALGVVPRPVRGELPGRAARLRRPRRAAWREPVQHRGCPSGVHRGGRPGTLPC